MKVCTECFEDVELRGFITSQNQTGKCDACGSSEHSVIDLSELLDFAKNVLSNFKLSYYSNNTPLVKLIQRHWSFFKNEEVGNIILSEILQRVDTFIKDIDTSVEFNDDITYNVGYWDVLKEQLRWQRRYITDINFLTDGELGWDGFFASEVVVKSTDLFYRGRLHEKADSNIFEREEMFSPDSDKASAGRANPSGIPYLYLCDTIQTVPYEIRAAFLDEMSIGTFQLKEGKNRAVRISDFTAKPGLFTGSETTYDSINKQMKSTLLKERISFDLSKPMRRYDSELDYIPTQFICEFLKSFPGVDGIKFKSSLHDKGNNYVIFDQGLMECTDVQRYKISKVEINAEEHWLYKFPPTN